jgi:hypothetical protein
MVAETTAIIAGKSRLGWRIVTLAGGPRQCGRAFLARR